MAVHTKHPVSAPPAAPVREKTGHLMLRAWCIFVLFCAFSGTAWVLAFGETVAAIVVAAAAVVSVVVWVAVRPPVHWQRLPWFPVAYAVWATLSLLWSAWPAVSAMTLALLAITTTQGLFVGAVLTWRELVKAIASALKWVMGLSILFELWVSIFVRVPVLPGFVPRVESVDPVRYWSRDNLFDGGSIQGILGDGNLLAPVALLAMIVFAIRYAARAPRRFVLLLWIALSAFLFLRAGSVTAYLAAAAVVVVLATVLLMRRAQRPGERTKYYIGYAAVGLAAALAVILFRDTISAALGRSSDLAGRERIWGVVLERASERPFAGWGFATPWVTSDPSFDGWITAHGESVGQAYNVWVDALFQLGVVGVVLLGLTYLALVWRAWFFAIDRPRWDLRADRPYSPLSLLPTLTATVLLVQGLADSGPLLLWGWMLVVLFAFKIKQAPHIGAGPAEQSFAIEQDLSAGRSAPSKRVV